MNRSYRKILILVCIVVIGWQIQATAASVNSASNAYERQDYNSAIRQFTELSKNNDPYAQYMLGKMYAKGQGTGKDYLIAYKWLQLAEIKGVDGAVKLKRKISKRMSRQKIAKANKLVEEWQRSHAIAKQPSEIRDPAVVRRVQQELANRGCFFDKIDGIAGGRTSNAIRMYQRSSGMVENGKITSTLLDNLNLSNYSTQPPATSQSGWEVEAEGSELTVFQNRLRKIIRKAKKRQAAEPWLIERLEKLAGYNSNQWSHVVLRENFISKTYQGGDAWRIIDGNFRLEQGKGLVGSSENNWGTSNNSTDDLASSLMNVLLNQTKPSQSVRKLAKIQTDTSFGNAFALRVKTGPLQSTEGLIFSCNRQDPSDLGYQLVFHPQQWEQVKLFSVIGGNATEIKTYSNQIRLNENSSHTFEWTRSVNGVMTVLVDEQQLFQVNIPENQNPFESLSIAHVGNRVVLQDIQLSDSIDRNIRF